MLCYTGEPRNSGTNNWEITKRHIDGDRHVFDCFERIRDTAAADARGARRAATGTRPPRCLATEWENRKRLAPGVTHAGHRRADCARAGGRRQAAKVCGAGGGGCLFCLAPPEPATAECARRSPTGGARLLDFSIETTGLHVMG